MYNKNVSYKKCDSKKIYFWFYYLMLLLRVPELFNAQQDRSRTLRARTKFLRDFGLHFSQVFFSGSSKKV